MIFPTLSASLLGFVSLVVAAPHLHSRYENAVALREAGPIAERGVWAPRYRRDGRDGRGGRNNNNNDNVALDITISELSIQQVDGGRRNDDVALVSLIQERLIVIDNSEQFRNNIRRNTFRNKNKNVNTVIIVVTEIVDARDNRNQNKRYKTRQFQSNKDIAEQVIIVISDSNTMTIDNNDRGRGGRGGFEGPTAVASGFASQSTGNVQQFDQYDPSAEASFRGDDFQNLLPFGAAPPRWNNARESVDPAVIILDNGKDAFVSFVGEEQNDDTVITIAVSS